MHMKMMAPLLANLCSTIQNSARPTFLVIITAVVMSSSALADWSSDYRKVSSDRVNRFEDWSALQSKRIDGIKALQKAQFNGRLFKELNNSRAHLRSTLACKKSLETIYGQLDIDGSSLPDSTYGLLTIYGALMDAMADSGASPENFLGLLQDSVDALGELQAAVLVAISNCNGAALNDVCSKLSGVWGILSTQFMNEVGIWIQNSVKNGKYLGNPDPYSSTYYQFLASPLSAYLDNVVDPVFALKQLACQAAAQKSKK